MFSLLHGTALSLKQKKTQKRYPQTTLPGEAVTVHKRTSPTFTLSTHHSLLLVLQSLKHIIILTSERSAAHDDDIRQFFFRPQDAFQRNNSCTSFSDDNACESAVQIYK
jgi:hypothetical protein